MSKNLFYTSWCFTFILDPLSYPLRLLISSPIIFILFIIASKKPFSIVSFTIKNSTKYSKIYIGVEEISTHHKTTVICSWWLVSGVQSTIIEKYFAFLIFWILFLLIHLLSNLLNNFVSYAYDNDYEFLYL